MKQKILKILKENKDNLISGTTLSKNLNITRSYVSKLISNLIVEGYDIKKIDRLGYIYKNDLKVLDKDYIYNNIKNKKEVIVLEKIDSTNNFAKKFAKETFLKEAVIVANTQTEGRGRLGRSFVSNEASGIYMSYMLKPNFSLDFAKKITCLAASAVSSAIDEEANVSSQIKWVNDIYINGKKVSGILTEGSTLLEESKLEYVVIGIGINTYDQVFTDEIKKIATTLENEAQMIVSRSKLIVNIINRIDNYLANIGNDVYMKEYINRSFVIGKKVTLQKYDKIFEVEVIDINQEGELVVKHLDGRFETISSGEITRMKINSEN